MREYYVKWDLEGFKRFHSLGGWADLTLDRHILQEIVRKKL